MRLLVHFIFALLPQLRQRGVVVFVDDLALADSLDFEFRGQGNVDLNEIALPDLNSPRQPGRNFFNFHKFILIIT